MSRTNKLQPAEAKVHHQIREVTGPAGAEQGPAGANVAQTIHSLRTEAGLTQRELADLVGTTASVICRLESAEYEGHSIAMLRRIATALDRRVEIRFVPSVAGSKGS